jgi:hypothetical protein
MARRSTLALALAALAIAAWPAVGGANAQGDALVVVVSPTLSTSDLTFSKLRQIFLGNTAQTDRGERFVPFNFPPEHSVRTAFDRRVLGMDPSRVGQYWIDRRIRGQGTPPRTAPSAEVLRRVVRALPGAISYIRASDLTNEVKALRIDGKRHDEPGYPLR